MSATEQQNLPRWDRPVLDGLKTPREIFEQFGVAEQTLANWRSAGKGPKWTKVGQVGRPGGFVYYDPDDVRKYLDDRAKAITIKPAS